VSRFGDYRLRGCIGTLQPRHLHTALREYALTRYALATCEHSCVSDSNLCYNQRNICEHFLHDLIMLDFCCSALKDKRFSPISEDELSQLSCTVSFLHSFEKAGHWQDWEIGTHGLIIEFSDPHTRERCNATYLPEIAAAEGWTKQGTIDSLIHKAGFNGHVSRRLRDSLTLTKYQSSAHVMTHKEYVARNAIPVDSTPAVCSTAAVVVQA